MIGFSALGGDHQFDRGFGLFDSEVASRSIERAKNHRSVLVLIVPHPLGGPETFVSHFVVESVKNTTRGSQRGSSVVIERSGVHGEGPTIVRDARVRPIRLRQRHLLRIDFSVGFGSSVSQVRIFFERWFDHSRNRVAKRFVLRKQENHAVSNLLEGIRHAIRLTNLNVTRVLIDGGVVPIQAKVFPSHNQVGNDSCMSLRAQVEVSGVEPPANVDSWNVLSGRKR